MGEAGKETDLEAAKRAKKTVQGILKGLGLSAPCGVGRQDGEYHVTVMADTLPNDFPQDVQGVAVQHRHPVDVYPQLSQQPETD